MRELDRRMAAAGQQAADKARAEKRLHDRNRKREERARKRLSVAQTATPQDNERVSDQAAVFAELFGPAPDPAPPRREHPVREGLERLSRDRRAPASARVTAMRTLAEIDGLVGRLQTQPADVSDAPLSTMTREQLENELVRLRAIAASQDA